MDKYVFPPRPQASLPIKNETARFPVGRIFCVGRNYVAHAHEMGSEVDREAPFYFTKSPYALGADGADMPYPPGTSDLHHEIELVVALRSGGVGIAASEALHTVFGFAVGLDMTRRDLQAAAKDKRRPWDTGKDFENAALIAPLIPGQEVPTAEISLHVNGELRQNAPLSDMVWSVPEIIAHLSTLYTLAAGDVIMTGTPAGVGPVAAGDVMEAAIDGLPGLRVTVT